MTTVSKSFTDVDTQSATLAVAAKGETVSVAISGTYNMTLKLQRAITPDESAWETLQTWTTANATVAYSFITERENEKFRLNCTVDTSGTAVTTISDGDMTVRQLKDQQGNVILTHNQSGSVFPAALEATGLLTATAGVKGPDRVETSTDAVTLTLTAADSGKTIVFNDADGAIVLPAATGTGNKFRIVVGTTFTGGTISCVGTNEFFGGLVARDADAAATLRFWAAADNDDTITLNGVATGGVRGDYIELLDLYSGHWHVSGVITQSGGSEATPFSAAV